MTAKCEARIDCLYPKCACSWLIKNTCEKVQTYIIGKDRFYDLHQDLINSGCKVSISVLRDALRKVSH